VNVGGTTALLEALRTSRVERLVLVSTCSNYGVSDPTHLADEDAPLHPLGIYAKSKVDAELAALAFEGPAAVTVLRLGTICGLSPKMRFDLLVNEMARAAVLDDALQIFAPEAWRPFLHIRDAGRAIEWTLRRPRPAAGQVYNVVGENYQKKGLADLVRRHFPTAALSVTDKIPDARDYRASGERIARDGFTPRFTVEDAFLEVVAAVRSGIFRDPRWAGHAAAPLPKE
jgi:nucleoside-diphosphate-sugar epimerase